MANSLVPLQEGFRYQAWLFWEKAALLLEPGSRVTTVTFEAEDAKSFDDVVVRYSPPRSEPPGSSLSYVHLQAKYHVGPRGAFTIDSLTDPAFIGASSSTILSNLGAAYHRLSADFDQRHFWVVSPWPIHPDDRQMGALWRDNTSAFRMEVLSQGTGSNSQWVQLRAKWREATGVESDEELFTILSRLRIQPAFGDLNGRFVNHVSNSLRVVGMKAINPSLAVEPYSQIPWNLFARGTSIYTKELVERLATEHDLWERAASRIPAGRRLGIRTNVKWGERMESTTDEYLQLENAFEGRLIDPRSTWGDIFGRVSTFLRARVTTETAAFLELDALSSVAFAAGYTMPAKDGFAISPIQRGRSGLSIWNAQVSDTSHGGWSIAREQLLVEDGNDVAIGLGVSRRLWEEMRAYVEASLPSVRKMFELIPVGGASQESIVNPGHALHLAREAVQHIREARRGAPSTVVHLFIAAPNGFAFLLGQEGEALGRCRLYEFDFGSESTGSYTPSLLVPDHTA